jgi:hypothetical protein
MKIDQQTKREIKESHVGKELRFINRMHNLFAF